MSKPEVSNKTVATLLVLAIVISLTGTLVSMNKINSVSGTTGAVVHDQKQEVPEPVIRDITGNVVQDTENEVNESER
jgi:hypothetical protein